MRSCSQGKQSQGVDIKNTGVQTERLSTLYPVSTSRSAWLPICSCPLTDRNIGQIALQYSERTSEATSEFTLGCMHSKLKGNRLETVDLYKDCDKEIKSNA